MKQFPLDKTFIVSLWLEVRRTLYLDMWSSLIESSSSQALVYGECAAHIFVLVLSKPMTPFITRFLLVSLLRLALRELHTTPVARWA